MLLDTIDPELLHSLNLRYQEFVLRLGMAIDGSFSRFFLSDWNTVNDLGLH